MKKILFIAITAVCMVGCKSYSLMSQTPSVQLNHKLPAMELLFDEQSFATITGYSKSESVGSALMPLYDDYYSLLAIGITESSSTTYASSDLNNVKSLFKHNMYSNIFDKLGEKKGKVVCRLVSGTDKLNYGFTVLSSVLLCIPNLFGMPFISNTTTMIVEIDFMDMNNTVVASYQSNQYSMKKYAAMYWGYDEPSEVSIAETFKLCLNDLNQQIKNDFAKLETIYNSLN